MVSSCANTEALFGVGFVNLVIGGLQKVALVVIQFRAIRVHQKSGVPKFFLKHHLSRKETWPNLVKSKHLSG